MATAEQDLQLAPSIADIVEWDRETEEPDLDIYIRCRRTTDAKGQPCSQWQFAVMVEGDPNRVPSQRQRDYAATAMRHVARVHQDVNLDEHLTLASNLARIAGMLRAEMKATMNMYVKLAEHLVRTNGLNGAASVLGLKAHKVRHLLRARGQLPESALNDQST